MILQYGNDKRDDNECVVQIGRSSLIDERGHRWGIRETWDVSGFLQAADQASLSAAIQKLESAYNREFQNLQLLFSDGSKSRHYLYNIHCLGGVRITLPVTYPKGDGAEYTTYRSYRIQLEGILTGRTRPDLLLDSGNQNIMEWKETLTLSGGGPRFVLRQTLNGAPVRQQTAQQTPYRATQSGQATGRYEWPSPPPPLFPADEHQDQRVVERTGPDRKGDGAQGLVKYPVTWHYVFESVSPLNGLPSVDPS